MSFIGSFAIVSSSSDSTTPAEPPFPDIPITHHSFAAIKWARDNRIFGGINGNFVPDGTLTRACFALILWRFHGQPVTEPNDAFSDIGHHQLNTRRAIAWAQSANLVTGSDGRFEPDNQISRQSMVLILFRYSQMVGADSSFDIGALDQFDDRSAVANVARNAVAWAAGTNLVRGSGGNFDPTANITRASVVLILHRYVNQFG